MIPWLWPGRLRILAEEHLARAEGDDERVNDVVEESRRIKAQNGFLAAIDKAIGEGHQ